MGFQETRQRQRGADTGGTRPGEVGEVVVEHDDVATTNLCQYLINATSQEERAPEEGISPPREKVLQDKERLREAEGWQEAAQKTVKKIWKGDLIWWDQQPAQGSGASVIESKSMRVSSWTSAKWLTTTFVWLKALPHAWPSASTRLLSSSIRSNSTEILDVMLRRYWQINSLSRFSISLLYRLFLLRLSKTR